MKNLITFLIVFLSASVMLAQSQRDTFLNAPDGQTVNLVGLGVQRLWGVNAPTKDSGRPDGAAEAQSALQSMMARTKITVEKREYGVIVYAENGISINLQMIESGWARNGLSTRDAEFKSFEDAQQNAVKMNRGIWGPNRLSTSTVAASPTVRSSGDISSSGPTLPEKRYGSDDGKFVAVVQARVTEVNSVWSRFSWRIVLTNNGTSAKSIVAMLEFQDKDGFALERTSSQRSTIAPGREEVLTEFELIDAAVAPRVAGVVGTIGEPR